MITPLISIIVPIYKVEPYLRKCVESILAQSYTNIEVILVDDGSPDDCPKICDEYRAKDSRVVVIHQDNGGVSAARNAGLDAAKGEYIGFVDGDDWIEPDMYEVLFHVITASGADIAASYDCIDDYAPPKMNEDQYVVFSSGEAMANLLDNRNDFISVWGKLYTKEVIKNIRFIPTVAVGEDVVFETEAIIKSQKVSFIDYQSYHYFVHNDSAAHMLGSKTLTILMSIDSVIGLIKDFDVELYAYAENHILFFDVYLAKRLEDNGTLTKDAYIKIVTHIRKYQSKKSWNLLPFRKKIWAVLLLWGRIPFFCGRKLLKGFRKFKTI